MVMRRHWEGRYYIMDGTMALWVLLNYCERRWDIMDGDITL